MHGSHIPHKPAPVQLGDLLAADLRALKSEGPPAAQRSQPKTASSEAIDFLKQIDPAGRHNLVAFDLITGKPAGRTFAPGAWSEMRAWVEQRNGIENIYFSINEPKHGAPNSKLAKDDIGAIRCICADVDPIPSMPLDEARKNIAELTDRICAGAFPPTLAVDSGGGEQLFWVLAEKIDAQANQTAAEAQGRAIANLLGGDAVQNIDRVMRLPGTINVPDAKKRAKGRVQRVARITHSPGRRWTLEQLVEQVAPVRHAAGSGTNDGDEGHRIAAAEDAIDMGEIEACDGFDDLPTDLRSRFATALEKSQPLRELWEGRKDEGDKSASGYMASLARRLARLDFDTQDFAYLCWVWPFAHGDKGRDGSVTVRALSRAWGRIAAAIFDPEPWHVEIEPGDDNSDMFGQPAGKAGGLQPYDVLTIDDLFNRPDPKFMIGRHIPEESMGFLYGDPGTGKSFIALDWALHLAYDKPDWFGDAIAQRQGAAVIYLAGEGASGFKTRVAAWMSHQGIPRGQLGRFGLIHQSVNFMSPDDVQRLALTLREKIGAPVSMVVVDTVSRAMPGADENLQKEMTLFVKACDVIKRTFHCAVLGVHHAGRSGDFRGSSVLLGAGDFIFKLERKKGASVGRLHCEKQKDAPDGWSEAYRFDVVGVGDDKSSLVPTRCHENIGPNIELTPTVTADVLKAMKVAWDAGEPWAREPQAKDRMASRRMTQDFGFDAENAERVIDLWVQSGLIVVDIVSRKSKRKGFRVVENSPSTLSQEANVWE